HVLLGGTTTQGVDPLRHLPPASGRDDLPVHVTALVPVGPDPAHTRMSEPECCRTPEPVGVPAPQVVMDGEGVRGPFLDGSVVDLLAGVIRWRPRVAVCTECQVDLTAAEDRRVHVVDLDPLERPLLGD